MLFLKKNSGAVVILSLLLFFSAFFVNAQEYDTERYFDFYSHELDGDIVTLSTAENYREYTLGLEQRMFVLRASWEKDRERLKSLMREGGDRAAVVDVDESFDRWENEVEKRVSRAKAGYLARHVELEDGGIEQLRAQLIESFSSKFEELFSEETNRNETGLYREFRDEIVGQSRHNQQYFEDAVSDEYEEFERIMMSEHLTDGIDPEDIHNALEREKENSIYEQKAFLARLVATYTNRAYRIIFSDSGSLRYDMETEHARRVVQEITDDVEQKLDKNVESKLEQLLKEDVLSEADVQILSDRLQVCYEEGLGLWARAAAQLVRRENEWYENYRMVYDEGIKAWAYALNTLQKKREQWGAAFHEAIEEARIRWDETLVADNDARRALTTSLVLYKEDTERGFDAYINNISTVLESGADTIGQIDGYLGEFQFMLEDSMSVIVPDDSNLSNEEYASLASFVENIVSRGFGFGGKNDEPIDNRDMRFWQPDKNLSDIFELESHFLKVEHGYSVTKTDSILGYSYAFVSKKKNNDGFTLRVKITADVRRWELSIRAIKGESDQIIARFEDEIGKTQYFDIHIFETADGWRKDIVSYVDESPEDFSVPVRDIELDRMADDVKRYAGIIDDLQNKKVEMLGRILAVQDAVIAQFDKKPLLENEILTDDEAFNDYFFSDEPGVILSDLEKELYTAYCDRAFWKGQFEVTDGVLSYAFDRAKRESAGDTEQRYTSAKEAYLDALEEYRLLLEHDTGNPDGRNLEDAGAEISHLTARLEAARGELSAAEQMLRETLDTLTNIKIADAKLEMLVHTMFYEASRAYEMKNLRLAQLLSIDDEKRVEAAANLLNKAFEKTKGAYERIIFWYFDGENSESLKSLRGMQEEFDDLFTKDEYSKVDLQKMISDIETLRMNMEGSKLFRGIFQSVDELEASLSSILGSMASGETVSKMLVTGRAGKEVYVINTFFSLVCEAREIAYTEYYEHSENPSSCYTALMGDAFGAYLQDCMEYASLQDEGRSEPEEIHPDPGYWEDVYDLLAEFENKQGSFHSVEAYLLHMRETNRNDFLILKSFFYNVLPGISDADRYLHFSGSQKARLVCSFFIDLLGDGNWGDDGTISPEISSGFYTEYEKALSVVDAVSGLQVIDEALSRLDSGFYSGEKSSIQPIPGSLDTALCTIFLNMDVFEENGLLHARKNNLLQTMADFCASCIYLRNEDDFEEVRNDPEGIRMNTIESIAKFFDDLAEGAGGYGFDEQDIGCIKTNMKLFLVYTENELHSNIENFCSSLSTDQCTALFQDIEARAAELQLFEQDTGYDIEGYFTLMLDEGRFKRLSDLNAELFFKLRPRDEYLYEKEYAERLGDYLEYPSMTSLRKVLQSEYTAGLLDHGYDEAARLIKMLCFYYIKQVLIDDCTDFTGLYEFIEDELVGDALDSLSVQKRQRDEIADAVLSGLLFTCRVYEAELYRSGDAGEGVLFSQFAEPWESALARIKSAIQSYTAVHDVYADQGAFEAFVSFIEEIDPGVIRAGDGGPGGTGTDERDPGNIDPGSDFSDGDWDFLRALYIDEARWDYAGKFFITSPDDIFQNEFLKNYDPRFQEFVLAENIFKSHLSLEEAEELFVFRNPLEESFHDIASSLLYAEAVFADVSAHFGFKSAIEKRLRELICDEWEDYRGVIYENRSVFHPDLDMYSLSEDTEADEVICAYNTVVLNNPGGENVLNRIYFEGYGDYNYTFGSDGSGSVKTAPTFVSGAYGLNSYIEFQNRFMQAIVSLARLRDLQGDAEKWLACVIEDHAINIEHFNSLDIFNNHGYESIAAMDEEQVSDLHVKSDLLSYYASDIPVTDSAGGDIPDGVFTGNGLLYLIASVCEAELSNSDLVRALSKAEEEAAYRRNEVDRLQYAVERIETEIDAARTAYNEIVEDMNLQKTIVDQKYRDYLEAKEVYFYAKNIYLADDSGQSAVSLYKTQLLDYAEKLARAEARFDVLREVKIQGKDIVAARVGLADVYAGDSNARYAGMGDIYSEDELARIAVELEARQESVNCAQQAFFILQILHALIDDELRMLEGEIDAMIQSKDNPDIPEELKTNLDGKITDREHRIDLLKGINRQYAALNLNRGSPAYEILSEGLKNAGIETRTEAYIYFLRDFIAEKGGEIFNNIIEPSIGMMVVELEDYVADQSSALKGLLEDAESRYQVRYQDFFEGEFSRYTAFVSKKEAYALEEKITKQEIDYGLAGLLKKEQELFEQYVSRFSGSWDEFDAGGVEEKYRSLLMLAKRKEQASELRLLYAVLTGLADEEELTAEDIALWGVGFEKLKEKYGIGEEDIVRFEDIVADGVVLDVFDFSAEKLMQSEAKRKQELFEEVSDLGYFNIMFGEELFIGILNDTGSIERAFISDRAAFEEYRFDLQLGNMVEEKSRFFEKVERGELNGIHAWEKQAGRLKGAYREWINEMRSRFLNAGEKWHEKEVEYITMREQWLQDVSGRQTADDGWIEELERGITLIAGDTGMDMGDMQRGTEGLVDEYIDDLTIPQWITDYEMIANRTFGRMRSVGLKNTVVEEAIEALQSRIMSLDEKKEEFEAERLYYQLKKAREKILAGIRGLDRANREMLEEFLTAEDVGFSKKTGGYEKKFVVDYSLLGGRKKETVRIREYGSYAVPDDLFRLAGIDELKSAGDSTEMKIFVMEEVERLRRAKEKVLGVGRSIGDIYREHIGRLPTEEDTARYVRENSSTGLLDALSGFVGKLMDELVSIFGVGKEESAEGDQNFSEYQMLLVSEISYCQNKPLETGRIMLEYQRYTVLEAEALAKEDGGFFDKPLIPGGPSLKSIGNVTAAIATAGTSLLAQTAVQVGWNVFTTSTTAMEGKIDWDEAGLDILKSTATSFGTFGLNSLTAGIKSGIDLGTGFGCRLTNAGIDTSSFIFDSAFGSVVHAVDFNESGKLGWSLDSFETGIGMGLAGSLGAFGGSYVASSFDVMHGASWSEGGYNYNVLEDAGRGAIVTDYFNTDMKRMGDLIGGLTEEAINNLTGAADGFRINVLNTADLGGKHEVGMLAVTLGSEVGFSWDVSTGGLNLAAYNLSRTMAGLDRVEKYEAQYSGGDLESKQNYTAGNLLRYADGTIDSDAVAALAALLEKGELYGFDYTKEGLEMFGEGAAASINEEGVLQWDLNSAAKYTSYMAYASENEYGRLLEEGSKHRAEYMITEEKARINAVESDRLLEAARDTSGNMLGNRVGSLDFSLRVWEGLKDTFNVADGEMDYYSAVFEYGGDEFEVFKRAQGQFMEGKNIKLMFAELEGTDSETIRVIASMYKGAIEAGGSDLIEELIERGIMAKGYSDIVKEIALGKQLVRDEGEKVEGTEIMIRDDLSIGSDIEGYFLFSPLRSDLGAGGVLLQRYGYTNDFVGEPGLDGSGYMEVAGNTEKELLENIEKVATALHEVIENPYILTERIFGDVFEGLRGESDWAKGNKDPVRFMGSDGREYVYLPGRSGTALCNYYGGNVIVETYAMLGETDYVKDEWYPVRQGSAKYERIANTELYYTKLAEDINKFMQEGEGKEYFTRTDSLIDVQGMSKEEFNGAVDEMIRRGFLPVWSWDNVGGGSSHIFVQTLGGQRWDVNYSGVGDNQFTSVPLTEWKGKRLSKQFENFLNTVMEYGKFDFKEEWKKFNNYSEKEYYKTFGNYNYSLSLSNYSVLTTIDIDKLLDYIIGDY